MKAQTRQPMVGELQKETSTIRYGSRYEAAEENSRPRRSVVRKSFFSGSILKGLTVVSAAFLTAGAAIAAPATIYVDQNEPSGGDGSAGAPFQIIADAVAALALSNAAHFGGNTISVASGIYTEEVYLTTDHAGTPSAPNTLLGVDNPVIDAEGVRQYGVHIHMATNFIIKGFHITGATRHGVLLNNNNTAGAVENWTIDSCWIYGNSQNGVGVSRHYMTDLVFTNSVFAYNGASGIALEAASTADILNCVFVGNFIHGYNGAYSAGSRPINIRNSVFVGNGVYGVSRGTHIVEAHYNLFYGNGRGALFDNRIRITAEDINELDYCSENTAVNPGYVQLNPFDPLRVYQPSALIGAGEDGSDIGIHGQLADTPVSSNIYYVAVTGSDARNKAEAQNPGTPWRTIQHAAVNMTAGDTARVAAGEYNENVVITNTSVEGFPVRFLADEGAVLNAGGPPNYGFNIQYANDILISGFEIRNFRRGIKIASSFVCSIHHCKIHADSGGASDYGILIGSGWNGAHEIVNCDIYGNGYGLLTGADGKSINSDFRDNAYDGIALAANSGARWTLENCNIYNNARYGMSLSTRTYAFAYNSNFVGNALRGATHLSTVAIASFWNCNFVSNGDYGAVERDNYPWSLYYCNFYDHNIAHLRENDTGATPVNHLDVNDINTLAEPTGNYSNNISVPPMFRDAVSGDFKLMGGSLCVDAGSSQTHLATDYYGNPRLVGPAVDIGVYEMPPPGVILRFW